MNRYMEQCPLKLGAIGNVILPSFMQITLATFVRYQEQQWTFFFSDSLINKCPNINFNVWLRYPPLVYILKLKFINDSCCGGGGGGGGGGRISYMILAVHDSLHVFVAIYPNYDHI